MNRLLTILLLAAGTAYGQIDNPPTSVNIVDSTATGRSLLTAASAAAGRGVLGGSSFGGSIFTGTSASARPTLIASILGFSVTNNLGFDASLTNFWTATNAAAATTAIGLGTANDVTFNRVQVGGATFTADEFSGGNFEITAAHALTFASGGTPGATLTNLGLGATNNVTFSNITASGTLGVTGNATLNGVGNIAPSQTADSADSLMTRDLVGQEFANPRNRMQTTYWFGLEGLGYWTTVGTNAVTRQSGVGPGMSGGTYIYSSTRIGANSAGAGLRLFNDVDFGPSPYRFSDGGALTMRARVRKNTVADRPAFAFLMGIRTATQMWQQNAYGLYFVPQPTDVWISNGVVAEHDRIAVSNVVWAVSTAGTNAATEPTWTDLIGSLVTNGSAVYVNAGPHTSNNWVLAIGSTNASQVVMTNTGKEGPPNVNRAEVVLKLRIDGTTNTPYTIYGSVQDSSGETAEVSLTTTNNDGRGPQFWSRTDEATAGNADYLIRYISIDNELTSF
jgi:hypothetical protein